MSVIRIVADRACDLCRKKRIKCDVLQPQCSACRLKNVECKYENPVKRRGPQNKKEDHEQHNKEKDMKMDKEYQIDNPETNNKTSDSENNIQQFDINQNNKSQNRGKGIKTVLFEGNADPIKEDEIKSSVLKDDQYKRKLKIQVQKSQIIEAERGLISQNINHSQIQGQNQQIIKFGDSSFPTDTQYTPPLPIKDGTQIRQNKSAYENKRQIDNQRMEIQMDDQFEEDKDNNKATEMDNIKKKVGRPRKRTRQQLDNSDDGDDDEYEYNEEEESDSESNEGISVSKQKTKKISTGNKKSKYNIRTPNRIKQNKYSQQNNANKNLWKQNQIERQQNQYYQYANQYSALNTQFPNFQTQLAPFPPFSLDCQCNQPTQQYPLSYSSSSSFNPQYSTLQSTPSSPQTSMQSLPIFPQQTTKSYTQSYSFPQQAASYSYQINNIVAPSGRSISPQLQFQQYLPNQCNIQTQDQGNEFGEHLYNGNQNTFDCYEMNGDSLDFTLSEDGIFNDELNMGNGYEQLEGDSFGNMYDINIYN